MSEHSVRKDLIAHGIEVFTSAIIAQATNKLSKEAQIDLEFIDSKSTVVGLSITDNPDRLIEFASQISAIEEEKLVEMWTLHNAGDKQTLRYRIALQKLTDKQTESLMEILRLKWFTFTPSAIRADSISSEIDQFV